MRRRLMRFWGKLLRFALRWQQKDSAAPDNSYCNLFNILWLFSVDYYLNLFSSWEVIWKISFNLITFQHNEEFIIEFNFNWKYQWIIRTTTKKWRWNCCKSIKRTDEVLSWLMFISLRFFFTAILFYFSIVFSISLLYSFLLLI